jgi:hypothetical protein
MLAGNVLLGISTRLVMLCGQLRQVSICFSRVERADGEMPARLIFISGRSNASGVPMDEVVSLTIERTNEVTL